MPGDYGSGCSLWFYPIPNPAPPEDQTKPTGDKRECNDNPNDLYNDDDYPVERVPQQIEQQYAHKDQQASYDGLDPHSCDGIDVSDMI